MGSPTKAAFSFLEAESECDSAPVSIQKTKGLACFFGMAVVVCVLFGMLFQESL